MKKNDLANLFHDYDSSELVANSEIVKNVNVKKENQSEGTNSNKSKVNNINKKTLANVTDLFVQKELKEYKTIYFNKSTLERLDKIKSQTNRSLGDIIDLAVKELEAKINKF